MTYHDPVLKLPPSGQHTESIRVEDPAPLCRVIVIEEASRESETYSHGEPGTVGQTRGVTAAGVGRHAREMPVARIFQRGRSAMQSGRARESTWLLRFEPRHRTEIDFLMGWTGSRDTLQQVELRFSTLDEAVAFAERHGFAYEVGPRRRREIRPKSYTDNFRHDRLLPWTH